MSAVTELWISSFEQALSRLAKSDNASDGAAARAAAMAAERQKEFLASLSPGYAEETAPDDAAVDWLEMSRLLWGSPPQPASRFLLRPGRTGASGDLRLRRIGVSRVELSSFLRVVESFGLVVVEAVPWHFGFGPHGPDAYIDDVGARVDTPMAPTPATGAGDLGLVEPRSGGRIVEALETVLSGRGELGSLNRLVIGAGLDWHEVALLFAYCAYRKVVGGQWAAEAADAIREALVAFPSCAAAAVRLFVALLVPGAGELGAGEPGAGGPADRARASMAEALAAVPDLEHDRALRELVSMVEATTRSNWALARPTVSLKFASAAVPFLPAPHPLSETFVWCPWFEALHVRFGRVARGGIRWSDRQADLRGEVLSLARAQVKKNSLIVPTGAKGAFVLRKQAAASHRSGQSAYAAFIEGLLDVTDNIVGGEITHPRGVVCRDQDDPYLVVAADKGTAHFSDLANSISMRRGFWLGDAFASGGSTGYDHKALGITAKGAWLAVRRHFRALGMDAQRERLRVAGVGDMSGDVFGNGMLQSESICLVAAFDHRHIFVDPAPDPLASYEERRRLSQREGSSWQDYDMGAASRGAAVYSRHAKKVELSPEGRAALGVPRPGVISPPELVKAVLEAQVDLIFFGGIGTFVKAPAETDTEVDDRANDEVRVNADRLRARVVAEGANLALTQRARTSYSRRGGRVDTDFIDNAGGVAMSDREVNLKILLGLALAEGRLRPADRDRTLAGEAAAVAEAVLVQVEQSVVALDRAAGSSAAELPAFEALMDDLARAGQLDIEVEALPDPEELTRRKQAGAGLSRPELAVLLAYARSEVAHSVEASPLAESEALRSCGVAYFPPGPRQAFADLIPRHPLFAQLAASELADELIARMGAVWAHEVAAETGRQPWEAAAAYWAAREVLDAAPLFDEVDRAARSGPAGPLSAGPSSPGPISTGPGSPGPISTGPGSPGPISTEAEAALRDGLSGAVGRLARWYLARSGPVDAGAIIAADRPFVARLEEAVLDEGLDEGLDQRAADGGPLDPGPWAETLLAQGIPEALARWAARLARDAAVGELAEVARASGHDLRTVARAYAAVGEGLSLTTLEEALSRKAAADRWERWELDLLADDLARARVTAVTSALQSRPAAAMTGPDGEEAARAWLAQRQGALARPSDLVRRLGPGAPARPSMPLLALAVRALGDAVRA